MGGSADDAHARVELARLLAGAQPGEPREPLVERLLGHPPRPVLAGPPRRAVPRPPPGHPPRPVPAGQLRGAVRDRPLRLVAQFLAGAGEVDAVRARIVAGL